MQPSFKIEQDIKLSDTELSVLKNLYKKKSRFLSSAGIGMFILWLSGLKKWLILYYQVLFIYGIQNIVPEKRTSIYVGISTCLLLLIGFVSFFIYLANKNIIPLRNDIRNQSGSLVSMTIERKSKPYAGRYFLFFDDLLIPYIEVNAADYYAYQVGQHYPFRISKEAQIQLGEFWNCKLI